MRADSFVWQARIEAPRGVEAEDDHFDLLPGEERRVRLRGPENLLEGVRVRSLNG